MHYLRFLPIRRLLSLSVAVLLFLGGSAAFAQQKNKEDPAGKSSPEALNTFADAANFQNNGAFDLAVEEWEKFLKQFSQDPLANKARHYAGVCHLQLKNLDQAAAHFQAVIANDPNFELAEDAYLNLGWCQFTLAGKDNAEQLTKAAATFAAHVDKFPKGKYVDQALFYLGESQYAQGKKQPAIEAYQELVDKHPQSSLRSNAMYALGVSREELRQYKEAGQVYDLFLKEFSQNELANEIRLRKGDTLFHTGAVAEAEKVFAQVAAIPGFAGADHAVFRQADCAAKQNKFGEAGRLYAEVASEFPQSAYRGDAMLAAGRCFYRAEKYADAATWLDKSIQAGGQELAEAAHWLSRIYLRQKEPDKAVELIDACLKRTGDNPFSVHLKMDQADARYELSQGRAESIDRYLKIVAEHPQHELAPQAQYNAAFAAMELKRYDDAIKYAASFQEKFPNDALVGDVQFVAAECRIHKGEYAAAEQAFRKLIEQFAQHAEAPAWRLRLGLAMYLQKKYSEAAQTLGAQIAALQKPEQVAEAQYLIGASNFEQGKFAPAVSALEASLAASTKWRQADETLLFLSRSQRALNKVDSALATVNKLVDEYPDSKLLDQAYYRLGEYHDAAGDFKSAVTAYDVVLAKYDTSSLAPYAAYGKGWAQLKAKQFAAGSESFSVVLSKYKDHPLVPDARFARAMCRRQVGQHTEAVDDIAAFLKSNPELSRKSDALYERGLAEVALENYTAAAQTFDTILKENQSYAHADSVLYELGWAWKKGDKSSEATTVFARLAKDYADSPFAAEASFHVGEDLYDRKQYADAAQAFGVAKQKGAGEVVEKAIHKLGWSQFHLGQYQQSAAEFAEQIEKFDKGSLLPDALFMKAESLFKLANYEDALPAFRAARENPANSAQMQTLSYLRGGQVAAQLKQWQESVKLLDQVPTKFAESPYLAEALYERGWAKQNLKNLDEAIADYEQAATKSRGEVGARARFMIGEIQFERKQHDEAIKSYLRVMYGYGGENASQDVKKWQASAGYEAGRCAEVQLQNAKDTQRAKLLQDAKTYYTFVAEKHTQHKMAAQAKERLAALAKLK